MKRPVFNYRIFDANSASGISNKTNSVRQDSGSDRDYNFGKPAFLPEAKTGKETMLTHDLTDRSDPIRTIVPFLKPITISRTGRRALAWHKRNPVQYRTPAL